MHVRVSSVHPPQEKITISLASRMTDDGADYDRPAGDF